MGVRQRWRVGLDCKSSAYGLEGSNPLARANINIKIL